MFSQRRQPNRFQGNRTSKRSIPADIVRHDSSFRSQSFDYEIDASPSNETPFIRKILRKEHNLPAF